MTSIIKSYDKIKENSTSKSFDVTLEFSKEYYWKNSSQRQRRETTGQIWKFKPINISLQLLISLTRFQ
jgi:hypothetical protein